MNFKVATVNIVIQSRTTLEQCSKKVPTPEFLQGVCDFLAENVLIGDKKGNLPDECFSAFFTSELQSAAYQKRDIWHPQFLAEFTDCWLILQRLSAGGNDAEEWYFCYRDNATQKYQPVQLPEACEITEHGDILFAWGTYKLLFPCGKPPWPLPVLGLDGKLKAIGRLNWLNQSADANPVTILCRSPQPYKGLGIQINKEMLDMLANLLSDYSPA